jgi:lipopolysaccharide exporter
MHGDSSIHHAPEVAGIVLLGVAPVVLSVSAASGPIVEVMLGAKWVEAWPIIAVLSWGCFFSPLSAICGMALVANGYVKRNFLGLAVASAVRLLATLCAVSLTPDLVVIGAVTAGCVVVESGMFLILLRGTGSVRLRPMMGGLARVVIAMGLAAGVVRWSGLGWHPGGGSKWVDLMRGGGVGALSTGIFGLAVLVMWQVAGRPEGAEKRLVRLAATLANFGVARSKGRS